MTMIETEASAALALMGGPRLIESEQDSFFRWPILTGEDEAAVLDVMRHGSMSGTDVTQKFECEFAVWQGSKYALGFNNGTASI